MIPSAALFDCIVDTMFAGKTVALEFVRIAPGTKGVSDFRGYWTQFRVLRADVEP